MKQAIKHLRRAVSIGVLVCFLVSNLAPLHASPAKIEGQTILQMPESFSIPEGLGSLRELKAETLPDLILIQDAHEIPEAQRNIAKLIDYLSQTYGITQVALEGASGELDSQIFRSFPDQKRLGEVLEKYFEDGEITGGTAAAITPGIGDNTGQGIRDKGKGIGEKYSSIPYPLPRIPHSLPPIHFSGVEDWSLFQDGIAAYQKAMSQEERLMTDIRLQTAECRRQKEETYSKEMLEIDAAMERFYENETNLIETLSVLSKYKAPEGELAILVKASNQKPETSNHAEELKKMVKQIRVILSRSEAEVPAKQIGGSVLPSGGKNPDPSPAKRRDQDDVMELNEKFQDYQTSQITAEAFGLYLKELIERRGLSLAGTGLLESSSPVPQGTVPLFLFSGKLEQSIQDERKLRDLEGTKVMEDFERYADEVQRTEYRVPSDQKSVLSTQYPVLSTLYKRTKELRLLKKLVKLELTREEWKQISTEYRVLSTEYPEHFRFYEISEKREQAFLTNLFKIRNPNIEARNKAQIQNSNNPNERLNPLNLGHSNLFRVSDFEFRNSVILVAGGFHTSGMVEKLKAEGISYAVVMPKISKVPEEINYKKHMQGDVSWKNYFRVEKGRINLYEAFVRGTRDRLISGIGDKGKGISEKESPTPYPLSLTSYPLTLNPLILKGWRDQILRDLSDQGRIAEAGKYTRFMDELSDESVGRGTWDEGRNTLLPTSHFLLPSLAAEWHSSIQRITRFIDGLKQLHSSQNLTEPSILNVLQSMSPAQHVRPGVLCPLESSILARSELRSPREPMQSVQSPRSLAEILKARAQRYQTWGGIQYGFDDKQIPFAGLGGALDLQDLMRSAHLIDSSTLSEKEAQELRVSQEFFDNVQQYTEMAYGKLPDTLTPYGMRPLFDFWGNNPFVKDRLNRVIYASLWLADSKHPAVSRAEILEVLKSASGTSVPDQEKLENILDWMVDLGLLEEKPAATEVLYALSSKSRVFLADGEAFYGLKQDLIRLDFYFQYYQHAKKVYFAVQAVMEKLARRAEPKPVIQESGFSDPDFQMIEAVNGSGIYQRAIDVKPSVDLEGLLNDAHKVMHLFYLAARDGVPVSDSLLWEVKKHAVKLQLNDAVRSEFSKLFLLNRKIFPVLCQMNHAGVLERVAPFMRPLKARFPVEAHSPHRFNLAGHTMEVIFMIEEIAFAESGAPYFAIREALEEAGRRLRLSREDQLQTLRFAGLYHDGAKGLFPEDGEEAGHPILGAEILVPRELRHFTIEPKKVRWIQWLIRYHQEMNTAKRIYRSHPEMFPSLAIPLARDHGANLATLSMLYVLSVADRLSIDPDPKSPNPTSKTQIMAGGTYLPNLHQVYQLLLHLSSPQNRKRTRPELVRILGEMKDRQNRRQKETIEKIRQKIKAAIDRPDQPEGKLLEMDLRTYHRLMSGQLAPLAAQYPVSSDILTRQFPMEIPHFNRRIQEELKERFDRYFKRAMQLFPNDEFYHLPTDRDKFEELITRMIFLAHLEILQQRDPPAVLVKFMPVTQGSVHFLQMTVGVGADRLRLLAEIDAALTAHGFNIDSAQIQTTKDGLVINHIQGYVNEGKMPRGGITEFENQVRETLYKLVRKETTILEVFQAHPANAVFPMRANPVKTKIDFLKKHPRQYSRMRVQTTDRDGLQVILAYLLGEGFSVNINREPGRTDSEEADNVYDLNVVDAAGDPQPLLQALEEKIKKFLGHLLDEPSLTFQQIHTAAQALSLSDNRSEVRGAREDKLSASQMNEMMRRQGPIVEPLSIEAIGRLFSAVTRTLHSRYSKPKAQLKAMLRGEILFRSEMRNGRFSRFNKWQIIALTGFLGGAAVLAGLLGRPLKESGAQHLEEIAVFVSQSTNHEPVDPGIVISDQDLASHYHPFRSRHTFAEDILLHQAEIKERIQKAVRSGRNLVFMIENVPFSDEGKNTVEMLRQIYFQHDLNHPDHYQKAETLLRNESEELQKRLQIFLDQWTVPPNYDNYPRALMELAVDAKKLLAVGQTIRMEVEKVTPHVWKAGMENLRTVLDSDRIFESGRIGDYVKQLEDFDQRELEIYKLRDRDYEGQVEYRLRRGYEVFDFRGSLHPPTVQGKVLETEQVAQNKQAVKSFDLNTSLGKDRISTLESYGDILTEDEKALFYAQHYAAQKLVTYFNEHLHQSLLSSYENTQNLLKDLTWKDLEALSQFFKSYSGYSNYLDRNKGRVIHEWLQAKKGPKSRSEIRTTISQNMSVKETPLRRSEMRNSVLEAALEEGIPEPVVEGVAMMEDPTLRIKDSGKLAPRRLRGLYLKSPQKLDVTQMLEIIHDARKFYGYWYSKKLMRLWTQAPEEARDILYAMMDSIRKAEGNVHKLAIFENPKGWIGAEKILREENPLDLLKEYMVLLKQAFSPKNIEALSPWLDPDSLAELKHTSEETYDFVWNYEQGVIHPEKVDLKAVLEGFLAIQKTNPTIIYKDPRTIHLWTYKGYLKRVLANLLDNAAHAALQWGKENKREGAVTIEVLQDVENSSYRIVIRNKGVIPEEVLDRVYDGYSTKEGGSGIGVPNSRRLTETVLGGRFKLEPSKSTEETIATLELPSHALFPLSAQNDNTPEDEFILNRLWIPAKSRPLTGSFVGVGSRLPEAVLLPRLDSEELSSRPEKAVSVPAGFSEPLEKPTRSEVRAEEDASMDYLALLGLSSGESSSRPEWLTDETPWDVIEANDDTGFHNLPITVLKKIFEEKNTKKIPRYAVLFHQTHTTDEDGKVSLLPEPVDHYLDPQDRSFWEKLTNLAIPDIQKRPDGKLIIYADTKDRELFKEVFALIKADVDGSFSRTAKAEELIVAGPQDGLEDDGGVRAQDATQPARVVKGKLAFLKLDSLPSRLYRFDRDNLDGEKKKLKRWKTAVSKGIKNFPKNKDSRLIPIVEAQAEEFFSQAATLLKTFEEQPLDVTEGPVEQFLRFIDAKTKASVNEAFAAEFLRSTAIKAISGVMTNLEDSKPGSKDRRQKDFKRFQAFLDAKVQDYEKRIQGIRESIEIALRMLKHYEAEKVRLGNLAGDHADEILYLENKIQAVRNEKLVQHALETPGSRDPKEIASLYMVIYEIKRIQFEIDAAPEKPIWDYLYESQWLKRQEKMWAGSANTTLIRELHQTVGEFILQLREEFMGVEYPPHLVLGNAGLFEDLILVIQEDVNVETFERLMKIYGPRIRGILATKGGLNSHWALVSQTRSQPPAVVMMNPSVFEQHIKTKASPGDDAVLHVRSTLEKPIVHINPTRDQGKDFQASREQASFWASAMGARGASPLPSGLSFKINTDLGSDKGLKKDPLVRESVGLVRTEVMSESVQKLITDLIQALGQKSKKADLDSKITGIKASLLKLLRDEFEGLLADPSHQGQDVTVRTFDLQWDKNRVLLLALEKCRELSEVVLDPQGELTGFNFYRNTSVGRTLLEIQLAAMYSAQAHVVHRCKVLKQEPPKLKIMFPMIKDTEDLRWLAEKIIPEAEQRAYGDIVQNFEKAEGVVRQEIGENVLLGAMIERREAKDAVSAMAAAQFNHAGHPNPNFQSLAFRFFSVGSNDAEEDVLTEIIQAVGSSTSLRVTRDHAMMGNFILTLSPEMTGFLNHIAEQLLAYNRAHPAQAPLELSICGDLAGRDKILPWVEYWRRRSQGMLPIALSTAPNRIPHLKYLARELAREDRASNETLQALFEKPNHLTDFESSKLVADMLNRDRDLLTGLEAWNKRFREQDSELAFDKQELNVEQGIGSAAEFDFLKAIIRALGPMGAAVELTEGTTMQVEDLGPIVSYLGKRHAFFYQRADILHEAFEFLCSVREVYGTLAAEGKIEGPIRDENIHLFLETLKGKGVKIPRSVNEIQEAAAEFTPQNFYEAYHAISLYVFDSISRTVHDLYSSKEIGAFPPVYLRTEPILGSPEFQLRQRQGLRLSRQRGYVEETVWEVDMPDAAKHIQAHPEFILEAFRLVAVMGKKANLSHETQKAICEYLSVPSNQEKIRSLMESFEDSIFRLAWIDWLSEKGHSSYGDFRLHQFGLLDLILEHYSKSMTRFSRKNARFSAGMQAVYMRQVMEGLWSRPEPMFRQVRKVHRRIRENKEWLRTLRMAAYIGPTLTKFNAADLEDLPLIENNVRTLLAAKKMNDSQLGIDFEKMVKDVAWILYFYHKISRQDLLTDEEQNPILDEMQSRERNPECLDMLYVYAMASRFSLFDPDTREMVLKEGEVSPLKSIDRLYERAAGQSSSFLEESRILDERRSDFQKALLEHSAWKRIKEEYLREAGLRQLFEGSSKTAIRDLDLRIQQEFENNFEAFFLKFCGFFTFAYVLSLDSAATEKLMVVFRILQILREDRRDESLILINRLPHHSKNAFEIIFLAPREDNPILPVIYSGALLREGFNTSIAQIRYTSTVKKSDPRGFSSYVKFLGLAETWEDEMLIHRNLRLMIDKAERFYRRYNNFSGLDGFFDEEHSPLVEKNDGLHTRVDFSSKDAISHSQSASIVTIESAERKGLLYSTLRWLYSYGFSVRDLRFDNLELNAPRIKFWLQTHDGKALSAEHKNFVVNGDPLEAGGAKSRMGLRAILDQDVINPGTFQMQLSNRSELRFSGYDSSEAKLHKMAARVGKWMEGHPQGEFIHLSQVELRELQGMAKELKELLQSPGALERLETLLMQQVRKSANRVAPDAEISLSITRAQAEAVSQVLIARMLSKLKDRDGALAVRDASNENDLRASLLKIAGRFGPLRLTLPDTLKGFETRLPRNVTVHFERDPAQISGERPTPLLGATPSAGKLGQSLFYIGLDGAESYRDEPFLGIVAQVLQMTAGLLVADRIQSVKALQDPDVQAALLKDLFESYPDQGQIIRFDEKGFSVNRSALAQFILSYQASRQSSMSA